MPPVIQFPTSLALAEASTGSVHAEFVDKDGSALDNSAISAITATLLNHLGAAVNGREAQNVKDANGGILSADGVFDLQLSPQDTAAVASGPEFQARYLTLVVTHSGAETLPQEIRFFVRKLHGHGV